MSFIDHFIDNLVQSKKPEEKKGLDKALTLPPKEEKKPPEQEQSSLDTERILNVLIPLQRGVSRIESQQPIKNFNERLSHLDESLSRLDNHCKLITRELSKQEELTWGEHYTILARINQSIVVEHGRLKPLMIDVVEKRNKDPLEDYPEFKGRVNIHPDELKQVLKKERISTEKVITQMEAYLHGCWRPAVEAYVNYAKFLEEFVLDRKALEGEFRKSLEKQKYDVQMENLPKSEIEMGEE